MNRAQRRREAREQCRPGRPAAIAGFDLVVDASAGCDDDCLHDLFLNAAVGLLTRAGPWPGALDGRPQPLACGCSITMRHCDDVDCALCRSDRQRESFLVPCWGLT
jgi:hypothetical protein